MGYLTDLTDEQWALIEPIIPAQEGSGRPREVDLRRVIDALMYMDRTGCQWRMFPLDFPYPVIQQFFISLIVIPNTRQKRGIIALEEASLGDVRQPVVHPPLPCLRKRQLTT
jgi:Putative transposase of IS4/5 family (DUF4096)